jgi:hypothetical protein
LRPLDGKLFVYVHISWPFRFFIWKWWQGEQERIQTESNPKHYWRIMGGTAIHIV